MNIEFSNLVSKIHKNVKNFVKYRSFFAALVRMNFFLFYHFPGEPD